MEEVKPFGQLSRTEQLDLFNAWLDNKTIEYKSFNSWRKAERPSWAIHTRYRIAPERPSIDWSHVSEEFNWLAVDGDGRSYLYKDRPELIGSVWQLKILGYMANAHFFDSFKPGNCDWRDSLVERPKND